MYKITVSQDGKFAFAVDNVQPILGKHIYGLIREAFPPEEGFKVGITRWDTSGTDETSEFEQRYNA